jgi:hypothetical protein
MNLKVPFGPSQNKFTEMLFSFVNLVSRLLLLILMPRANSTIIALHFIGKMLKGFISKNFDLKGF